MESLYTTVLVSVLITTVSSSRPSQFPGAVPGPDGELRIFKLLYQHTGNYRVGPSTKPGPEKQRHEICISGQLQVLIRFCICK